MRVNTFGCFSGLGCFTPNALQTATDNEIFNDSKTISFALGARIGLG